MCGGRYNTRNRTLEEHDLFFSKIFDMWGMPSNQGGGGSGDMMTPMGDQKFTCKREKCKGVLTPIGSVRSHIDSLAKARQRASEASQKGIKLTHGCCLSCEYVKPSFYHISLPHLIHKERVLKKMTHT